MNIVVLAGGFSPEREVSLSTGGQVANALTRKGHKVLVVDSYKGIEKQGSFEELYLKYKKNDYSYDVPEIEPDLQDVKDKYGVGNILLGKNVLEVCRMADIVFMGLHGSIGENGQLQAIFDVFDIKYTGNGYISSLLSMDKLVSKALMVANNILTPQWEEFDISKMSNSELIEKMNKTKLPVVVKPYNGGSSLGATLVKTNSDIAKAIEYVKKYEDKILVEQYISGREFTVGIIDGKSLPVIEICTKDGFFDYTNKYQPGLSNEICPAQISKELEKELRDIAIKVNTVLRLDSYSRIDFMVDEFNKIYCLEANALPGMTPNSLIPQEAREDGMSYDDLCEKIVNIALDKKNIG